MKIIDKNTDFYDYYQNIYTDDTFTFDRTDSFVVTKDSLCQKLFAYNYRNRQLQQPQAFLLLQVCHSFWLFFLEMTKINEYNHPEDYQIELLASWKNYQKKRAKIRLDIISFNFGIRAQIRYNYRTRTYDKEMLLKRTDVLQRAIDTNDYQLINQINKQIVYSGSKKLEKHIPLLKACGIANCVDPLDIFLSLEEYFSLEKTAAERTEPLGTTDKDKVESHGFDLKTSFRKIV